MKQIDLSVVVVTLVGSEVLQGCLQAIASQKHSLTLEVIVPLDGTMTGTGELQRRFAEIIFLPLSGRRTYAELRAAGVAHAKGDIVAVIEDHCRPRPDWARQIVAAHGKHPNPAIGGVVEKAEPDRALNWAVYFLDYLRYALPMAEGPSPQLTDLNVSYKRLALNAICEVWAQEFHEPIVHGAFQKQDHKLWLSPSVVVEQQRSMDLRGALRDRYAFGRLFGSTRVAGAPALQKAKYLAATPLVPAINIGRILIGIARKRRHVAALIRSLPFLIVLSLAWGIGEGMGYATGRTVSELKPQDSVHPAFAAAKPADSSDDLSWP